MCYMDIFSGFFMSQKMYFVVKMVEEAYEQDVIGIDGDYPTYEMRQSSLRRDKDRRGSKYR